MTPTSGTRPVSSLRLATNWRLSTVGNQTYPDSGFDRQKFLYRRLSMLLHFPPLLSTPAFSTPAYSTRAIYSCIFHHCYLLLLFPLLHFPLPHFQRPLGLTNLISGNGCGRGLYANVDQSPLSGRGHVTTLDQSKPYDVEL